MDFPTIYNRIESATKSGIPLRRGMRQTIDECARQRPHEDWNRVAELDFEKDFIDLRRWLARLLDAEPPPASVTGLWFGLFNPVADDGQMIADLYVSGSIYDEDDADWACDPLWWAEGRYAGSRALADLCRIAYREGDDALQNDAEYPLALAYACLAVRDLATALAKELGTPERALFVGFDSGDLLCIGAVGPSGVRFSNDSESLILPGAQE